mgnify:CR=1 FL=1
MTTYFVRRGSTCKGPIARDKVRSLFEAGKLKDTDGIARSKDGPWKSVATVFEDMTENETAEHQAAEPKNEINTYAVAKTDGLSSDIPDTTPCSRCGNPVGFDVDVCMQCGTPNNWEHPQVRKFRKNVELLDWGECEELNWQWTRTSFWMIGRIGTVSSKSFNVSIPLICLGGIAMLFMPPLGSLLLFGGIVTLAISIVSGMSGSNSIGESLQLNVDYSTGQPVWNCSHPDFFAPVLELLELSTPEQRRPRARRKEKKQHARLSVGYVVGGSVVVLILGIVCFLLYALFSNPHRIAENLVHDHYAYSGGNELRQAMSNTYTVDGVETSGDGRSTIVSVTSRPPKAVKGTMYEDGFDGGLRQFYVIVEDNERVVDRVDGISVEEAWVSKYKSDSIFRDVAVRNREDRERQQAEDATQAAEVAAKETARATAEAERSRPPADPDKDLDDLIARLTASLSQREFVRFNDQTGRWMKFRVGMSQPEIVERPTKDVELRFDVLFYWAAQEFETQDAATEFKVVYEDDITSGKVRVEYTYQDRQWVHSKTLCSDALGRDWTPPTGFVMADPIAATILSVSRSLTGNGTDDFDEMPTDGVVSALAESDMRQAVLDPLQSSSDVGKDAPTSERPVPARTIRNDFEYQEYQEKIVPWATNRIVVKDGRLRIIDQRNWLSVTFPEQIRPSFTVRFKGQIDEGLFAVFPAVTADGKEFPALNASEATGVRQLVVRFREPGSLLKIGLVGLAGRPDHYIEEQAFQLADGDDHIVELTVAEDSVTLTIDAVERTIEASLPPGPSLGTGQFRMGRYVPSSGDISLDWLEMETTEGDDAFE